MVPLYSETSAEADALFRFSIAVIQCGFDRPILRLLFRHLISFVGTTMLYEKLVGLADMRDIREEASGWR